MMPTRPWIHQYVPEEFINQFWGILHGVEEFREFFKIVPLRWDELIHHNLGNSLIQQILHEFITTYPQDQSHKNSTVPSLWSHFQLLVDHYTSDDTMGSIAVAVVVCVSDLPTCTVDQTFVQQHQSMYCLQDTFATGTSSIQDMTMIEEKFGQYMNHANNFHLSGPRT